jgi:uncharacterized membrane protein (UPF0127 family)
MVIYLFKALKMIFIEKEKNLVTIKGSQPHKPHILHAKGPSHCLKIVL